MRRMLLLNSCNQSNIIPKCATCYLQKRSVRFCWYGLLASAIECSEAYRMQCQNSRYCRRCFSSSNPKPNSSSKGVLSPTCCTAFCSEVGNNKLVAWKFEMQTINALCPGSRRVYRSSTDHSTEDGRFRRQPVLQAAALLKGNPG